MRGRDETAHVEAPRFPRHEPERVQEEVRVHNADSIGSKVIDQSEKQSGEEEGTTREAEAGD